MIDWIPVAERLPVENENLRDASFCKVDGRELPPVNSSDKVLVCYGGNKRISLDRMVRLDGGQSFWEGCRNVTHWAEINLPESES